MPIFSVPSWSSNVFLSVATLLLFSAAATAGSMAAPGDLRLRHDLELLNDAGKTNLPMSTWPIGWRSVGWAMSKIDESSLIESELRAYHRVMTKYRQEADQRSVRLGAEVSVASRPSAIRSFDNTPRDDRSVAVSIVTMSDRYSIKLQGAFIGDAADGDSFRPDGSIIAANFGNWIVAAGWQDRWWGPGQDGSLIYSTNARPVQALSVQRDISHAFESRWLQWIGPWSLTAFMGRLDDERQINEALLFGIRGIFRPSAGLEIGVSRAAQWCGDGRPCGFSAFTDMLLGRDNQGVNVARDEEPGNQLAGFDARWALPGDWPLALYFQWIGEDTRRGGPEIGSWLRQAGVEYWGEIDALSYRTHFEVSDTSCRAGGLGFSEINPDCAYEHSIYRTGYRFNGRSIGHGIDGDGLSYSIGSTLVQSAGHSWSVLARYAEINRVGAQSGSHSLSAVPMTLSDLQVSHSRKTAYGRFNFLLGVSNAKNVQNGERSVEQTAFVQWRSKEW